MLTQIRKFQIHQRQDTKCQTLHSSSESADRPPIPPIKEKFITNWEIRKGLGRGRKVAYDCPYCQSRLVSPLNSSVRKDKCPDCRKELHFPKELIAFAFKSEKVEKLPAFPSENDSIIRGNITVGSLSEFIHDVTENEVVIQYPDSQHKASIASIREWNRIKSPDSFIFSADYCFCAVVAEKKSGYLRLTFQTATQQVREQYFKLEKKIGIQDECVKIMIALQKLESRIEVGIDPMVYGDVLTSIWHDSKRVLKRLADDFPCFCNMLQVCLSLHLDALNQLRRGANLSGISFTGIGFGIRGAAEAFAVSYLLNSLVGSYNQKAMQRHCQSIDQLWSIARLVLRDLERNFPSI